MPAPFILRPYQDKVENAVRQSIIDGHKKVIMCVSTGGGKTAIFFDMAQKAVAKGGKVLILIHRRDLVYQTRAKFRGYGMDAGIIMAGVESDFAQPVQIASIWTYIRRLQLGEAEFNTFFCPANLILVDECHRSLSEVFSKVLDNYQDKVIVGATATPCRADGKGMGTVYDKIVDEVPISELINNKFLTPFVYYGGDAADMTGVRTVLGDYDKKELGKRTNTTKLVGNIVQNWLRLAANRQTIVFAVNRAHARHLTESFCNAGIRAEYLDAHNTDAERETIIEQLADGRVQIVVNVALFQEFLDVPAVSCIVLARNTKSMGLYRQMCGRACRSYPGKKDAMIIDHGGCVQVLGFIEDEIQWTLDGKDLAYRKIKKKEKERPIHACESCGAQFKGAICPLCHRKIKMQVKPVEQLDVDLKKLGQIKKVKATMMDKRKFYAMLLYRQRDKGYQPGWVAWTYKAKFGVWPRNMPNVHPAVPDQAFNGWMQYRRIKYAKLRQKKQKFA